MSVENGEWIMYGVDEDDPYCIHTVDELIEYIDAVGFLPLFKNDIPGFSVEERTVPDYWWTGKPQDPWYWREVIARSGKVAYGKFFHGRAGFISTKWLPDFVNYRRDGYDFDALWDDAKANVRSKKIMDCFDEKTEKLSFELKQQAGFGKGGEKNFDGIVTGLQMQLYLCVKDFRQKINKKGVAYGWPIAVYCMPEHLWGRELVTSAYREDPAESGEKIFAYIKETYPIATEKQIRRILGRK